MIREFSNDDIFIMIFISSEPEFLNILKCDLAESASTGFQFNCYDTFNDKTLNYKHLDHF